MATNITASMVKELRDKTGAGMMDCKAALGESGGDLEAAVDWLRKKGLAKAAKKAGRIAADGLIGVALSAHKGLVVEVNSETDFVARNDLFQGLVKMIADVALDVGADVNKILAARIGDHTVADAIAELVETLLQLFVNTLSFLRVGAFALAHAGLASAIVALAASVHARVVSWALLLIGNAVMIVVETLIVGIQTTRLVLFEFFIRFVHSSGRPFRPLPSPDLPRST